MISVLAVYSVGQVIEMATIGREGCTGVQAVFGAKSSSARYFAQIPGNSSQRRGHPGAHQGRCAGAAARRAGARLDLIAQERIGRSCISQFIGLGFLSISGLNLLFALSDLVGASRFGYPAYSVLVIALFMAIGYGVWRVASWWLRWYISMNFPSD